MIQKNKYTEAKIKRFLVGLTTAAGILSAFWCSSFVSLADVTGTVTAPSAHIRERADANSAEVGSTSYGQSISIKSQTTDASGAAWYEVHVESGRTGFIRADLVEKSGEGDIPQTTSSSTDNQSDAGAGDTTPSGGQGATVQAENAMDAQYATVSVNAKIRPEPSTNNTEVASITAGAQVVVSGQSNGKLDNNVWYYVTFTGADGGEKTGFIRSDLLALGDMVPVPEEEPPVEPEAAPEPEGPVYNDYELYYDESQGVWCLIDNTTGGEPVNVRQLLDAVQNQSDEASDDAKALVKQRIAIVVLVLLAVVLVVAVIIMAVKLRDAYYEDYEDDEDEDEEEEEDEETPPRRRRRVEEEEEEDEEEEDEEEEEETPPRRRRRMEEEETVKPVASTTAKRKAKNFLLDDDEFEFEFLNMDDKN